jgi:hypothetical protein
VDIGKRRWGLSEAEALPRFIVQLSAWMERRRVRRVRQEAV